MSVLKNIGFTILISAVFIGTLVLVLYFFPPAGDANIEAIHLFIALFPFLVLLVLSGKLKEISGPGGIGVILQEEARKPISPEFSKAKIEVDPDVALEKGPVLDVYEDFGDTPPTTLTFIPGRQYYYNNDAIKEYLNKLEDFPTFKNILFTDENGVFKGFMPAEKFKNAMFEMDMGEEINAGTIMEYPEMITAAIPVDYSNQQALNEMDRMDTTTLAVVDRLEKFVGVIHQDEIVRKVLAKLMRQV